jgi:hypothetical protein
MESAVDSTEIESLTKETETCNDQPMDIIFACLRNVSQTLVRDRMTRKRKSKWRRDGERSQ